MTKQAHITPAPERALLLARQELVEAALNFAADNHIIRAAVSEVSRLRARLNPALPGESLFTSALVDAEGNPATLEQAKDGVIILCGSHGHASDQTPDDARKYSRNNARAFADALNHLGIEKPVLVGTGYRLSRDELRACKYELERNPHYCHPCAFPFAGEVLLPLLQAGERINLATYSFGGIFLRMAMNHAEALLRVGGMESEEIAARFARAASVQVGPNYNPTFDTPDAPTPFHQAIILSPNDHTAIRAGTFLDERMGWRATLPSTPLDDAGMANIVWVSHLPRIQEFNPDGSQKASHFGHRLFTHQATGDIGYLDQRFLNNPAIAGAFQMLDQEHPHYSPKSAEIRR
jgi:hypothetical protein